MRVKNYLTGKTYMTDKNAYRHFCQKFMRLQNRDDLTIEDFKRELNRFNDEVCIDYCSYCESRDFGMCGLRHYKIDELTKVKEFCIPAIVESMKRLLNE